jgi:putative tryptophan/tyrosine transport system substrate-binding protein
VLYIGLADSDSFKNELREGLRELGYLEGKNVAFEFRSAEGQLDRLPGLAAELVQLHVDVIVTLYVPPSLAAKRATHEIPIVAVVGDPVETGIVPSLARPGGNITGVSLMASALHGKSVELFRDMMPQARRVGVLGHSTNPVFAKAMLDEVLLASGPTGIEIKPVVMVRGADEFETALMAMTKERADAVVVQGSLAIKALVDMAIKYRLPTASTTRAFADIGGLMSFGADGPAAFRHGAKFVQRILQGRHPQDIPIEQPTKFELVINVKTAKAIGLTVPETFLLRADAVIE